MGEERQTGGRWHCDKSESSVRHLNEYPRRPKGLHQRDKTKINAKQKKKIDLRNTDKVFGYKINTQKSIGFLIFENK